MYRCHWIWQITVPNMGQNLLYHSHLFLSGALGQVESGGRNEREDRLGASLEWLFSFTLYVPLGWQQGF